MSGDNIGNLRKGFVMKFGKIGVVVIVLVPFNVYAECTPTLDCASIGYTETSCETEYLACPFDSTKLKCMPCDSSFRYDCSGDNITGGIGSACGGKYVSCTCSSTDYIFSNGSCICDTSCSVGNIYYSDGTCSSCVDSNKTAIGIVVKDNELVMSNKKSSTMYWSNAYTDTSLTNYGSSTDAKTDFNGKSNTAVIVAAHPTETVDNNAAIYCNSYSTEGTNAGDWYLPAAGELYSYVYSNYSSKLSATDTKLGWILSGYFWSSSEKSNSSAWYVGSYAGNVSYHDKPNDHPVSCFLAID